jgi:hypothetical protein
MKNFYLYSYRNTFKFHTVVGDGVMVGDGVVVGVVVSKAVVKMGLPIELIVKLIIGASVAAAAVGSAFKFDSVFAAKPVVATSTSAIVVAWLFELLSVASAELISTL